VVVIWRAEQHFDLERGDIGGEVLEFVTNLVTQPFVGLGFGELDQLGKRIDPTAKAGHPLKLVLDAAQALGDALRLLRVVPEVRIGGALFEGNNEFLLGSEVKAAPGRW
jgi:hypothetical protein